MVLLGFKTVSVLFLKYKPKLELMIHVVTLQLTIFSNQVRVSQPTAELSLHTGMSISFYHHTKSFTYLTL